MGRVRLLNMSYAVFLSSGGVTHRLLIIEDLRNECVNEVTVCSKTY